MPDNNEILLLQQLKAGSEQAYEAFYEIYHKRLYSFAFKYLKSRELSEDAVHDTFIKLWENRTSITSSVKAFLFTTARNHVLNMIRNQKRKVVKHVQLEQRKTVSANRTEEVVLYSEYQKILLQGLNELPEGKREIFQLKSVQGMTNREIAENLDISIHTVKSQYYQASKFIKEYLDKHAGISRNKTAKG
jgi:RNA polymerase sigma-70 factor (family 1)